MDTFDESSKKSKIYKLGKYNVTQQAFIIFILGCIITVIVALSGFYTLMKNKSLTKNVKLSALFGIFIIAGLILAYTCFVTYVTNCLSVGKCNLLAWIYVIIAILYTVGFIFTSKLF